MTFLVDQEEEGEGVVRAGVAEEGTLMTELQDNLVTADKEATADLHLLLNLSPLRVTQKLLPPRTMVGVLFRNQRRITEVETKVHAPLHLERLDAFLR